MRSTQVLSRGEGRGRARSTIGLAIRLLVSAALIGYLLSRVDLGRFGELLGQAKPLFVATLLVLLLGERFYGAYRLRVLMRCGDDPLPASSVIRIVFTSTFFGIFLVGALAADVLRAYGLARENSDASFAVSAVLLDRLLGLASLVVMVLVGLSFAPESVARGLVPWAWASLVALLAAGAVLLHPATRAWLVEQLPERAGFLASGARRVSRSLDLFADRPGVLAWAMLQAVGFQLFRILIVIAAAAALRVEAPLVSFLAFVPIINFLGFLPISIGGLGVREAAFVSLFETVGVGPEAAFATSLLIYFVAVVASLPGAWFYVAAKRKES